MGVAVTPDAPGGRWRSRRALIGGAVLLVVFASCSFGTYRTVARLNAREPYRQVDLPALRAQVAREQPVGGTPDETVAFLRRVGFEDRYIRIRRYSALTSSPGQVVRVEGWIPQPRVLFRGYARIRVSCRFSYDQRLEGCDTAEDLAYEPPGNPGLEDITPVPVR